jgi:hypothetical protein
MDTLDDAQYYTMLAASLEITPQQAKIVQVFLDRVVVSADDLREIVPHVSVAVHRLRERLHKVGVAVVSRYGIGYSLGENARELIQARIDKLMAGKRRAPAPLLATAA